ncbi:hypothetical protein F5J12DRAFT_928906 [Pisolithus orientalis]|uniref:uncharacterized protein n=1 Tax=Pisolithus orientalis TaxID=936130 RepID=UPI002225379F|nr:uncharacterized protein F5J12DRAFT_928906 [Pisolithus orientalis]KAI5998392.1 hypothetical protein F5J12DRAFT_928906 [Pisolithus orientalis]
MQCSSDPEHRTGAAFSHTVPPVELEPPPLQCPDVADAAVTSVLGREEMEIPRAYVVPARTVMEEMATTIALGIQDRASRKAAPHKESRRGIVLVEYMPKRMPAPRKILRRELRACAASDMAYPDLEKFLDPVVLATEAEPVAANSDAQKRHSRTPKPTPAHTLPVTQEPEDALTPAAHDLNRANNPED